MKKLTYIILAICVMLAAGCPSDSEMTDSISEAEAAVESHNTYTVTFDPNGGDGRAFSQSFRGGRMQPLMRCSFKRTGWTFSGGWAVEPDGEKVYRNNEQVILTKDLTLYAVWTAHKYTIKFDANGGSGDMEDLSMTYDVTKHLSPNEFTRAGYGFTGWNTASDGSGTSYANGAGISNLTATDNDAVTLYAQWAAGWVDYTVRRYFQTVDGAAYAQDTANYPNLTNSGITDTETAETADPITGFTAQPITQQTIAGDGSTVVNIYYNRNWITYTFSANGGKWSDSTTADKDVSGYYGASVEVPVPEKTGYHYTWDSTVPTEFDDNDGAEFTAQWTANSYTIVFDANGGTGTMSNQDMTYDVEAVLIANAFVKTGYTFLGWSDSSSDISAQYTNNQSVSNLTTGSGEIVTLYAIWKANTYNVVFNVNGGSGVMANQVMTYDTTANLNTNAFYRTGYTFQGWAISASGAKVYNNAASVSNLSSTSGGTYNLYAKWTAHTYTVKFNNNGGFGSMSNLSMTYGTAKALTANTFTRAGYTFLGWSKNSSAASAAYTDGQSVSDLSSNQGDTVTLYAVWKITAEAHVGDIMYSDMTFSTEYVEGKTPIGIVFEVGAKVKIVHLRQASKAWCLSSADGYKCNPPTSTSDGSGNWQIICDTVSDEGTAGNYPAFEYVIGLGSGWYLPAKDELNAVYTNKTAINTALTVLSTAGVSVTSLGTDWYCSSSSLSDTNAWRQSFSDGFQGYIGKYHTPSVRAVRAF